MAIIGVRVCFFKAARAGTEATHWCLLGSREPGLFSDYRAEGLTRTGFRPTDTATSKLVAVVNQAFVKKFFPTGADPIGAHFGWMG